MKKKKIGNMYEWSVCEIFKFIDSKKEISYNDLAEFLNENFRHFHFPANLDWEEFLDDILIDDVFIMETEKGSNIYTFSERGYKSFKRLSSYHFNKEPLEIIIKKDNLKRGVK